MEDKILVCKRHNQELFHVTIKEGVLEVICKECEIERNEGREGNADINIFFTKTGESLCNCIADDIRGSTKKQEDEDAKD